MTVRSTRYFHIAVLAASLLASITLVGCQKEKAPVSTTATQKDENLVTASGHLLGQIKVTEVSTTLIAETLKVAGRIDFDEQRLARIGATVTGRITHLDAHLGHVVKKGDTLAELHSSELSTSQLAYLKSKAQMELNRRNVERAKSLFDADVISAAELQRRENEFQISSAETRAAADQLRVLGVPQSAIDRLAKNGVIDSNTPVVSSIAGVVVERKVSQGQVVEPTDALFVVADLSRLWAVAQAPEQQIEQVKVGQAVTIEVAALDREKLVGKLIYVGQTVNPDTRTVLVRTELDNSNGRLKPAMLASMIIQAKPEPQLFVPASAVVRENDEDFVFLAGEKDQFRMTRVKLAAEHDGKRVILDGLKGGEKVVSEGAFHLNNERIRQALEGNNQGQAQ
jgi:cobalt-zinc-cadmium efflux system membrane fusion protein